MSQARADCTVCDRLSSMPAEQIVYDDGTWAATAMADVPGWINLAVRDHVEGIGGLSAAQAATFGPVACALGAAIQQAACADRVQLVHLGDMARHFHMAFFPRAASEQGLFDDAGLRAAIPSLADRRSALALADVIRVALM